MYSAIKWSRRELRARFPGDPSSVTALNFSDSALQGAELAALCRIGDHPSRSDATPEPICSTNTLSLNVAFNRLASLRWITGFHRLLFLNVAHNAIDNLDGISQLAQLQVLDVSSNKISTLAPLADCKQLRVARVNDNSVNELEPLALEGPALCEIYLYNNPCCEELDKLQHILNQTSSCKDLGVLVLDGGRPRKLIKSTGSKSKVEVEQKSIESALKNEHLWKKAEAEEEEEKEKTKKIVLHQKDDRLIGFGAPMNPRKGQKHIEEHSKSCQEEQDKNETRIDLPCKKTSECAAFEEQPETEQLVSEDAAIRQSLNVESPESCPKQHEDHAQVAGDQIIHRTMYSNAGREAVIVARDGTCTVRWPNGNFALSIKGDKCLAISEKGVVVASFDGRGSGTLNYENGKTFLSVASSGHILVMGRNGQVEQITTLSKAAQNFDGATQCWTLECGKGLRFKAKIDDCEGQNATVKAPNNNEEEREDGMCERFSRLELTILFRAENIKYRFQVGGDGGLWNESDARELERSCEEQTFNAAHDRKPNLRDPMTSIAPLANDAHQSALETSASEDTTQHNPEDITQHNPHCLVNDERPESQGRAEGFLPTLASITSGLEDIDMISRFKSRTVSRKTKVPHRPPVRLSSKLEWR